MRSIARSAGAGMLIAILTLGGCGTAGTEAPEADELGRADAVDAEEDGEEGGEEEGGDGSGTAQTSDRENTDEPGEGQSGTAPDLVGKGLGAAKEQAEADGLDIEVHDATGRTRVQVVDKNWQVCFQAPEPGAEVGDRAIELAVVKLTEDCPPTDLGSDPPELDPDNELPDFTGRSLAEAVDALGRGASITPVDATDADRNIIVEKNWQVCSQTPEPGTRWDGEPVTLDVVKYDESCPAGG